MELANTTAQRSSDLSRQVGAAILTAAMEVQAVGCNEVPKAGGGAYWEGDDHDGRDFALGRDSNDQRRRAVLADLLLRLIKAGVLKGEYQNPMQVERMLEDSASDLVADSQLMDSLEYGRSVHAEMSAILDAARTGTPTQGCILFSNTFPCHNCAKHIVACGISEVIYIHPYPKSYAKELFADSISVNPSSPTPGRVIFRQFIGIQGPMYSRVFTKARWKSDHGIIAAFDEGGSAYIRRTPVPAYEKTEELILDELQSDLLRHSYLDGSNPNEAEAPPLSLDSRC